MLQPSVQDSESAQVLAVLTSRLSYEGFREVPCTRHQGSECEFHPALVCSCGKCDNELKCHAKAYKSKHVLTCSLHVV